MINDALGNPLKVGDRVHFQQGMEWTLGRVVNIEEGQILSAAAMAAVPSSMGQNMQILGSMRIVSEFTVKFDPKVRGISGLIKVVESKESRELAEKLIADAERQSKEAANKTAS